MIRSVTRSLSQVHDWNTPEMTHVVVNGLRAESIEVVEREVLRDRELALPFVAVIRSCEKYQCLKGDLK